MLIYVTRSGEMSLKSHFGKQLLRKWSGNENFSIQFILIQLCGIFRECTNCLFELQMTFSQNSYTRYRVVSYTILKVILCRCGIS